jgi:hypothetical protein
MNNSTLVPDCHNQGKSLRTNRPAGNARGVMNESSPPPAPGRQLLCSEPCLYNLYRESDGTYVLEAEVNRTASYTIKLALSDEEIAHYQAGGAAYVMSLALRVDSFPEHYRARAL